jgi:hypothetical protein
MAPSTDGKRRCEGCPECKAELAAQRLEGER